jgi:uncharacterized protein
LAVRAAVRRSPVTALLGPRQSGKTTPAKQFGKGRDTVYYDLESESDLRRLENPEHELGSQRGLVVLDEVQAQPALFRTLRVLVDRRGTRARFLLLGSASPDLVRGASETLAGRVEFVDLSAFDLGETGGASLEKLWLRGGFPRSFLARSEADSAVWREGFVRTFLERDVAQFGFHIPAPALRRFWTMLAHYHGQTWNSSELGRSMGLSDKTVRVWLDVLTGAFLVRQLQPWHENLGKRQVRAPKVYLRDSGLLHHLLGLPDRHALLGHPRVGASWEGFALEQVLRAVAPPQAYFWSTYQGTELDLLLPVGGRRYGVDFKFSEAPDVTRSMRTAVGDLSLERLFVVYPGDKSWEPADRITVCPLRDVAELAAEVTRRRGRRPLPTARG